MSWVRLRQVALVVHELEAVVEELGATLGLRVGHRDPAVAGFGLQNAVLPLGNQFVEIVSPIRAGTAGGRQLERLGGDGGYMVIGHTGPTERDHQALRERVERLGIRVALESDIRGYRLLQLHPGDTGGSFLELDFQPGGDDPNGPWMPAGPHWQEAVGTEVVTAITGVEVQAPDPDAVAERWAAITGCPRDKRVLTWDNATITFTEGSGGLVGVDCRGAVAGDHTIGGVRFRVRPARVEIHEYDDGWPAIYERQAQRIRQALGERVVRLAHVGSTSVPGLAAKPVIDIALEVPDTTDEPDYRPALEAAGYRFAFREPDWFEHRMFKDVVPLKVNLHVFPAHCPETDQMLLFRNWLREHPSDRDLYLTTKRALAARDWPRTQDYADAKTAVVTEILARARTAAAT